MKIDENFINLISYKNSLNEKQFEILELIENQQNMIVLYEILKISYLLCMSSKKLSIQEL